LSTTVLFSETGKKLGSSGRINLDNPNSDHNAEFSSGEIVLLIGSTATARARPSFEEQPAFPRRTVVPTLIVEVPAVMLNNVPRARRRSPDEIEHP
jgi:hypothetical protein